MSHESDLVVAALVAALEDRGLTAVPRVVSGLMQLGRSRHQAISAVLGAAEREIIELRPEGGFGRLSPEERQLCPMMTDGTLLSTARLL